MRSIWIVSIVGVFVASADTCSAQESTLMRDGSEFVEKTERDYAVGPEGMLTIDADYGSVRIESWTRDEVDILVEKRYKGHRDERARQTFEHLRVETSHKENEVGIRVDNQNEGAVWYLLNSVSLEMRVQVPETFNLDVKTVDGKIIIGNMKGVVTAGAVDGNIKIASAEGDVNTSTIDGNTRIGNARANVTAEAVDGMIEIDSVEGYVSAKTTDGNIKIKNARAHVTASAVDGKIDISDADGDVNASTTDGNIWIGNVRGMVTTKAVDGNIKIENAYRDVSAVSTDGNVEATLMVSDSGLDPRCHLVSAEGDITIHIPDDLAASIEAEGSSGGLLLSRLWREEVGHINSDFGLNQSEWGVFFYRQSEASGDINGGGDRIRLKTNSGNIYIKERIR